MKAENIVLVGLRNIDAKELEFIKQNNIKYYPMDYLIDGNIQNIAEVVMEFLNKFPAIYVSIDVDAVDPGFAPGSLRPGQWSARRRLIAWDYRTAPWRSWHADAFLLTVDGGKHRYVSLHREYRLCSTSEPPDPGPLSW